MNLVTVTKATQICKSFLNFDGLWLLRIKLCNLICNISLRFYYFHGANTETGSHSEFKRRDQNSLEFD